MFSNFFDKDEIHIYKANISDISKDYEKMSYSLSSGEKKRVGDFINQDDRKRFILARYVLRTAIYYYTGVDLSNKDFAYTQYKKPFLDKKLGLNIEFNIAHAGDIILVAFSKQPIGIDIELEREIDESLFNELVLTKNELEYFKNINYQIAKQIFCRIWVNKEAYIKLIGLGFYYSINLIEINFGKAFNVIIDSNTNIKQLYIVHELDIRSGYKAAVAIQDSNATIMVKDFLEGVSLYQ
jgi:4'-phosphopantetheinyl transferase